MLAVMFGPAAMLTGSQVGLCAQTAQAVQPHWSAGLLHYGVCPECAVGSWEAQLPACHLQHTSHFWTCRHSSLYRQCTVCAYFILAQTVCVCIDLSFNKHWHLNRSLADTVTIDTCLAVTYLQGEVLHRLHSEVNGGGYSNTELNGELGIIWNRMFKGNGPGNT